MTNPNERQIQVKASDEVVKGVYSTMAQLAHSREEFLFDFMTTFPPQPQMVARIIISPSHAKRMLAALADNIKKYEAQYGKIAEGQNPAAGEIGFKG